MIKTCFNVGKLEKRTNRRNYIFLEDLKTLLDFVRSQSTSDIQNCKNKKSIILKRCFKQKGACIYFYILVLKYEEKLSISGTHRCYKLFCAH